MREWCRSRQTYPSVQCPRTCEGSSVSLRSKRTCSRDVIRGSVWPLIMFHTSAPMDTIGRSGIGLRWPLRAVHPQHGPVLIWRIWIRVELDLAPSHWDKSQHVPNFILRTCHPPGLKQCLTFRGTAPSAEPVAGYPKRDPASQDVTTSTPCRQPLLRPTRTHPLHGHTSLTFPPVPLRLASPPRPWIHRETGA